MNEPSPSNQPEAPGPPRYWLVCAADAGGPPSLLGYGTFEAFAAAYADWYKKNKQVVLAAFHGTPIEAAMAPQTLELRCGILAASVEILPGRQLGSPKPEGVVA